VKHQLAAGGRRVDRFGQRSKSDFSVFHVLNCFDKLLHGSGESVELPYDEGIAIAHIIERRSQLRPVTLCAGGFLLEDTLTVCGFQRIKLKRRRLILR
jgi:hypothetical protein